MGYPRCEHNEQQQCFYCQPVAVTNIQHSPGKYWMCNACGTKKGGVIPSGSCFTTTEGTCAHCYTKDIALIPWVDFDWPEDKKKTIRAKNNRD